MRETCQILLTSNYDASLLLFCDGAYSQAIATIGVIIVHITIIAEVENVRVEGVVGIVRSRTPIVALSSVAER